MSYHYYRYKNTDLIIKSLPTEWPANESTYSEIKPIAEGKRQYESSARARLLKILKPNDTVYTVLRHVSQSGMSRRIDLYVIKQNKPVYISGYASMVMDRKLHDRGGIVVGGCGMDMGFSLVYDLGSILWPNGTKKPHGTRNGQPDNAGGYALKHEWL